ncbi:MAG: hypothetical protein ACRDSJ_18085 [Rubrobacteraceae bacterium]
MQEEESRKTGEDAPEGRDDESFEGEDAGRPTVVNVIQQNAVIITGRGKKGGRRAEPDESNS